MVQTIRREDYRAPAHLIDEVRLEFDLDAESTAVVNTMHVRPNPAANGQDASLFLDGEDLTLVSVALDGKPLDESRYTLSQEGLLIRDIREPATVTIVNRFSPAANTALSGIYVSGQTLISQCEAQGFRRITFYMDRPDVLAKFTTVIRASKETFPVLLSNGNAGEAKDLEARLRHRAFHGVDEEQNAVDHREDAFDFAAEVRVPRGVDDVDVGPHVFDRAVLGENRDAAFAFDGVRIHHALFDLLVGTEGARALQQTVDEGGLAVVDVRNDRDVANGSSHSV